MDQKTKLTIIGGVVLLIVAAVLVTFFYFGRISKNTGGGSQNPSTNPLTQLPTTSTSTSPTPTGVAGNASGKTFAGQGFTLTYPNTWGILTCNNSQNFEFDPTVSTDTKNVVCDTAVKPITVLVVSKLACTGKTKTATSTGTNYRWCVAVGNKGLDITHRVSSSGSRATSKDDFSAQIEEMIKTIKATPQGS